MRGDHELVWTTYLAKLMSVYELTSTFLGPGPGEEQEGKFLGRSICWRSYGLTWTGDVKLVNEALQEWGHVNLEWLRDAWPD